MATLSKDRASYFRKLAKDARAGAANMDDYGARQTLMQAAAMWDLVAEREQERSSNRSSQLGPPPEQPRVLSVSKPPDVRPKRMWVAVRSLAKILRPQPHH
jgi:hypothetical protein